MRFILIVKRFKLMNNESSFIKPDDELLPSSFAMYVRTLLTEKDRNIIIPGCGNGADALFFAGEHFNVLAISNVKNDIKYLNQNHKYFKNIRFLYADHTQLLNESILYDMVYSRSILSTLSSDEETQLLRWCSRHLKNGARLCIETTGKFNMTTEKGYSDKKEAVNSPKRSPNIRQIDFKILCTKIEALGFKLNFAREEKVFTHDHSDDETLIRIIARKT